MDKDLYRLHAKLPIYWRHVGQAKNIIKQALNVPGTWAVSCSGGKDSVLLLYLCLDVGWKGPVLYFYYDEMPPENNEFIKKLTSTLGLELHLLHVPGEWDAYKKVGHFFVFPETPEEKKAASEIARSYKRAVTEYVTELGWAGQFLGLSGHESRPRKMMLAKKGPIYKTRERGGIWTACPLANWTGRDVWAYTFEHDIPYLPRYDIAEDPETHRSEETYFIAESAWRHGMAARLKKENPDEFNRLVYLWPEIRRYV